jgi:AcrR family transcriptional regulator
MPRAQREQLILDLAGGVFAGGGFHAASMDEIARLAGVSKPMLYTYFGSKEGLYLAYIERSGQDLVERLQRAFAAGASDPSPVRTRVDEFLAFVEEHRDGWKVLFTEASASRPVAEQVAQLRVRVVGALARLLVSGGSSMDPRAVEAAAHAIVGAGESLANWWLDNPEVARDDVAGCYVAVIRGTISALSSSGARR